MNTITVKAKTLDEAITKALIELGTTSDNLDYTIIDKGSAGIFGLFGKDVVIEAKKKKADDDLEAFLATGKIDSSTLEPPVKEKKKEKEKEAPRENREKTKEASKEKEQAKEKEAPKKNSQKNQQKNQQRNQQKAQREEAASETKEEPRQNPKQQTQKPPKKQNPKPAPVQEPVKEQPVQEDSEDKKPVKKIDVEACDKAAKEFLSQVFGAMGMEVAVDTSFDEKEREMTVDLSGADMGILIGKRGQTLDSLQYLTSLVVNKKCEGYVRVKLDTENYRERRKDTLETLAKNIAYKVKRTRRSVSLEPMNPYERRIIHAALQSDRYVVTRSEGEDPYRHVVISLKRDGRDRRDGRRNQGQNQNQNQNQNQSQNQE